ncbi:MAG: epimerase [Ruegeria sp.]
MSQTALILGANGRFGRNASQAFSNAGWAVRRFDRRNDELRTAARGADVIVNAWNPPYPDWARQVPDLHRQVIDVASEHDLTVIVPGNVYVFGADTPGPWSSETPHLARNPLGRIRIEMEEAYRASSVRTIMLRAGDFIDTTASGNWFDQIMIKRLQRGRFVYPGNPDIPHAWAYLPDLTRAAAALADMRSELPRYCDVPFAGYTVTGNDMAQILSLVTGQSVEIKQMAWWQLQLARPFWRLAPHLIEMRYLWDTPHQLDDRFFSELLPGFVCTELSEAMRNAIPQPIGSELANRHAEALRS